ncbi:hypothetical protein [Daejeonella sp.]|jgi:hypothetical protein|uniref:hypothetical protein n=1 Tax=Daejeonella sp. TaxID=2805397 RepID=UPI0037BFD10A
METTFKVRASAAGKIMGAKGLGETGKSFCKQWLKEHLYKRRPELKSKYIDKGNRLEDDGLTMAALELNLGMIYKNDEFFQDDFFCGTPDLIHDGVVYDNKCSWSLDTFPMFESEIPNKDYYYQLQVYMHLTGCTKASLCYTLVDADYDLVSQAVKWLTDKESIYRTISNMVYTQKAFDEFKQEFCHDSKSYYFVEIPESDRLKVFSFDYDADVIAKLQERVQECQEYINSLLNK